MVLGVPSPPRPCNRSRVALLFTAYGEERNSLGKNGGLRLGRGLVLVSLCGRGGLNLTPPRLWPERWIVTGLTQRSNRRLWESVSVCWTTMEWPRLGLGIGREKNEKRDLGFGIISSRYSRRHTHLRVRHLYLLRPGSLVRCLSCGTVVAVSGFVVVCLFKSQKNLGVSLPAVARALLGTIIWFHWLPVW